MIPAQGSQQCYAPYSEPAKSSHIQNPVIFRILKYSESRCCSCIALVLFASHLCCIRVALVPLVLLLCRWCLAIVFSNRLELKFVFCFKYRVLFNIFCCFCVFVNKNFIYPGYVCIKK